MTARDLLLAHGIELPDLADEEACTLALHRFVTPEQIERLEGVMLDMLQVEIPVVHRFAAGVYMREAFFPKGTFAIGHAHREDCLNVVLKGSARVLIEGVIIQIQAPYVMTSQAYDRKVGYVTEDMVWLTVHATKETCPVALERLLLHKSPTFLAHEARMKLQSRALEAIEV